MRILLINPLSKEIYSLFFPLGLSYIAGTLLREGHEIGVWDIDAQRWSDEHVLRKIKDEGGTFDLVGITALADNYRYIKWLTKSFKEIHPQTKIILGGHLASALPEFLLDHIPLDFIAVGEGEQTMVELAEVLTTGSNPLQVNGLYFRGSAGEIMATPPRARLENLDVLPFPPWDYFPMHAYLDAMHPGFQYSTNSGGGGIMSIMASRGCPFGCIYCDHTVKGHRVRYRPVEDVVNEIKVLRSKFGQSIKTFYFWDDILIWDREWITHFCEVVLRENLDIRWTCNCHVKLVEPSLLESMKEAGCINVRFGIESGSQKILDSLKKGVNVEEALNALRTCLDAGLNLTIYIMVGMTGENEGTINETVEFFKRLCNPTTVTQITNLNFFIITPFPGTTLFDKAREKGLLTDVERFLENGCDAHLDIPLNISGQSDEALLSLKKKLENNVSLVMEEAAKGLQDLLTDMKAELSK